MKDQLDQLMRSQNFDALWITGPANHNPSMRYFTGESHLTHAELFIRPGREPLLFHSAMERDEAAGTGLSTKDLGEYQLVKLIAECDGDVVLARAKMYQAVLEELELAGSRVALYGKAEVGSSWGVLSKLSELLPALELVGEGRNSLLLNARATKNQEEIDRIRKMGEVTTDVVSRIARFLQSRTVGEDQVLLTPEGEPLTVKDVKSRINLWLAEKGVENPEGVIFAIGRDAGVPHSAGTASDLIRLGKTIVFDIFPCEPGGGYFYDFTRTWCLGYAPEAEKDLHQQVLQVYKKIIAEMEVNQLASELQERTCQLFSEGGHQTVCQDPQVKEGYVHSLGHGLGLDVHERPWFGRGATAKDVLSPGVVVTIEPGLYYPEREMGCRIEDTVWMSPEGHAEVLMDYPLDLVLPMDQESGD